MTRDQLIKEVLDRVMRLAKEDRFLSLKIELEDLYEAGYDDGFESCAVSNGLETEGL